jgi:regulator of sigma E protease
MNKSPLARIAISAAGPLANFLFAFLVLGVLYTTAGKVYSAPVIGEVVAGSAADRAGLKPGDTILSIDGHSIDRFEDLAASVQLNLAKPLVLHISRQSTTSDVTVVPDITEQTDLFGNVQRVGRLGVRSVGGGKVVRLDPGAAVVAAAREVYETSVNILVGIRQIITGSRSSEEVGGILRIAKLSGDVANLGIVSLIGLAALFSVNLGLLNLFPIPILDGGQIVYYLVEFVRGRPLTPRAQEWGLRLGLAALVGLMLFATWNDLVYLKVIAYIKALFT